MENKSFLLIFCGIPSSGKSTIAIKAAKILESRFNKPAMVVSTDNFREMLPMSRESFKPEREPFIRTAASNTISLGLQNGYVIINDDLNYYVSMRKDLSALAKSRGAGFGVIYVNTPLAIALKWNLARGKPIPQDLIEDINAKFEEPGRKYQWDKPIAAINPGANDSSKLAELVAEKTMEAMKVWGKPLRPPPPVPPQAKDIEKVTRRAMGEIMNRFKRVDLADELSDVRRMIARHAIKEGLSPEVAVKSFIENSEEIVAKYATMPEGKTIFHVGLFGHVDHGKTALARCLTERASTAALDKHPEAQRREMTIDMGFSSFSLKEHTVNLVDLPGHYTLIKQATAGATIIDVGLLIVAADEGPNVQTLEHLRILENFGVKQILVVITKKDLASNERLEEVKATMRRMLDGTIYSDSKMVATSAETKDGIADLKETLFEIIKPPIRNVVGPFRMPVDHAFHIKGMGTVATGTVLRGTIKVGEDVELQPAEIRGKVRSFQMFGATIQEAKAGDRVGVVVSNIKPSDAFRGSELCAPSSLYRASFLKVESEIDKNFGHTLNRGDKIHVSIGLQTITASFTPFYRDAAKDFSGELYVALNSLKAGDKSLALLTTDKPVIVGKGDRLLMMKLDLPPKTSRVVGVARLVDISPSKPEFVAKKVRKGTVSKKIGSNTFALQGLFQSKEAANYSLGKTVVTESGATGKISSAYGPAGEVSAEFGREVREGETVSMVWYRRLKT